ncbi:unnamed protein product [Cladocopium goreaui]|uniref:Uncharacterized protein n=1 Tax=Cladocopium goreaui TaxID=2562237 RepID=A0A9P1FVT2_9DINO|nr:unnamed protein product [Cladocopium goreaui]
MAAATSSWGFGGYKSTTGSRAHSKALCKATQHEQELQAFLLSVERDEEGFEAMMDRIRRTWQAKLEATRPSAATEPAGPVQPKSDFCLPMQQIQSAKMCPLFQSKCGAPEPQRCMVSL